MANDGTGATWDETHPASGDLLSAGETEIVDIRVGVDLRMKKEHIAPTPGTITGSSLNATGGGEHLAGSAVAYFGTSAPTNRPDGNVALGSSFDTGRLWVRTNGGGAVIDVLSWNGSTWISIFAVQASVNRYAVIADQKASSTSGGTFTSGAWQTRTLQTEVCDNNNIVSISSNQFTLGAGTYRIKASAPALACDAHQIRLNDTTNSVTYVGTVAYASSSGATAASSSRSELEVEVVITGNTVYEIDHRCQTTRATDGFGIGSGKLGVTCFTRWLRLTRLLNVPSSTASNSKGLLTGPECLSI